MSTSSLDVHTADICTNRICKWPGVKLMECPVIDVAGNGLIDIISIASSFGYLTEVLLQSLVRLQYYTYHRISHLFVTNKMFGSCNNALFVCQSLLSRLDGLEEKKYILHSAFQ
jgi:hypothetical protein